MKKIVRVLSMLFSAVMIMGVFSFLFGCKGIHSDPWKYKEEDQGFFYYVSGKGDEKYATILGLVNEDLERDELIIPVKLGGYKVTVVGAIYQQISVGNRYYGVNAINIKRIVINHELALTSHGILEFTGDLEINARIELWRADDLKDVNIIQFNTDTKLIDDYSRFMKNLVDVYGEVKEVIFDASPGKQTTYAIITKNENLLIQPNDPVREKCIFSGWYKENDNKWNFEEDKVTESITLCAKWEIMEA